MTVSSATLFSSADIFSALGTNAKGKASGTSQANALLGSIDTTDTTSSTESEQASATVTTPAGDPANLQGSNLSSDIVGALIAFLQGEQNGSDPSATTTSTATTTDTAAAASTTSALPLTAAQEFAKLDTDGDGEVSEQEFVAGRPSDMSEDQATALFSKLDPDGTGSISEAQFSDGVQQAQAAVQGGGHAHHHHGGGGGGSSDTADAAEDAVFNALDTNHDGVVSMAEYMAGAPTSMSSTSVSSVFSDIDTDDSGGISQAEFKTHIEGTSSTSSTTTTTAAATLSGATNADDTTATESFGASLTSLTSDPTVEEFLQSVLNAANAYNSTYSNASLQSSLMAVSA